MVFAKCGEIVESLFRRSFGGEVYFPTTADMAKVYGHDDEINLPMATQVGFIDRRSVAEIRREVGQR